MAFELIVANHSLYSAQSEVGSSGHSASSGDLISGNYKKDGSEMVASRTWNPFEDTTPFSQAVPEEEDLFGAEFDKIRQEGSLFLHFYLSSKYNKLLF